MNSAVVATDKPLTHTVDIIPSYVVTAPIGPLGFQMKQYDNEFIVIYVLPVGYDRILPKVRIGDIITTIDGKAVEAEHDIMFGCKGIMKRREVRIGERIISTNAAAHSKGVLLHAKKSNSTMFRTMDYSEVAAKYGEDFFEKLSPPQRTAAKKQTQKQTKTKRPILIDGWLSQRMKFMLRLTAENEFFMFEEGTSTLFRQNNPSSLNDCSLFFNRIGYIPLSVLQQDSRGLFESFHDGYFYCFQAIEMILRRNETPTVRRIEEEIINRSDHYDQDKFHHYINRGGLIEFALYAVIQITENVLVDGDDGYEYSSFVDEIEKLPSNPMDSRFDLARLMCIERGGGIVQECTGPFQEVTFYGHGGNDDDE